MVSYIDEQTKRGCKLISVWPKTCGYGISPAIQGLATWGRQFVVHESSKAMKSCKDRVTTEIGRLNDNIAIRNIG